MAHDVFVCHSAKDKTTADAVCAMLESNGIRCWIAPRDVTPGMEWSECIIDAIEECRVMVLVFTTNANESGQIRREIERAVNRGVAILPIRIEDILPARALEYFIGNVHWLDALTPPLESHLQNLAGTVKLLLGRLPQHGAVIPHGMSQPEIFPQSAPIPQPTVIPAPAFHVAAPPVRPVAPERSEWTEPARVETPRQIPTERAAEASSQTTAKQTDASTVPPPKKPAVLKQKRAIGIVVIAVVVFLFSAFFTVGTIHDSFYGRFELDDAAGMALGILGIAASYGVITKKRWGRILQLTFSAACVVWLLTVVQDAFSDSKDVMPWIGGLGFSAFVIWYMFTPRVKQEFAEAAGAREKHFPSMETPGETSSVSPTGLFTKGAGPRPTAVLVIAILSFVEAAIWILGSFDDLSRGRLHPIDICALILLAGAVFTGYGLLRLMEWARFLKLICSAFVVVILLSVAQKAFHEGGFGEVMWIAFVIYFVWSAWYLFTPKMSRAFRPAN